MLWPLGIIVDGSPGILGWHEVSELQELTSSKGALTAGSLLTEDNGTHLVNQSIDTVSSLLLNRTVALLRGFVLSCTTWGVEFSVIGEYSTRDCRSPVPLPSSGYHTLQTPYHHTFQINLTFLGVDRQCRR